MSSESDCSSPSVVDLKRSQEKDDQFIVSLVMAVEKNPILYNHKNPLYRNTEKKVETWNSIKESLKYVGDTQELADYWKIVRDRYTKARRKFMMKKPTKFKFLNECCFLNPHITDRSSWYDKTGDISEPMKVSRQVTDAQFYTLLIQRVKENPCFYDNNDFNYRRFQYKVALWQSIAQELDFSGDHQDMYKQWKKMRDRYVREVRKLKVSGKSKENCKWEFFSAMDWMEPYIEEQRPLEEFETIIHRKPEEAFLARQVRKVKPKQSTMPSLQKMTDIFAVDSKNGAKHEVINISDDSDDENTSNGQSHQFRKKPAKRRRVASTLLQSQEDSTQNKPTQYIYYVATAGSQIQLIDGDGKIITAQGQFVSTPTGPVFSVVQPSVVPQFVLAEPSLTESRSDESPVQYIEDCFEQPLEVDEPFAPLECGSEYDENVLADTPFYNPDSYFEEVADVASTDSLADDLHFHSFGDDIPNNFLVDEENENVIINDLNETSESDPRFNVYQRDNDMYESMPGSFLAF